MADKKAFIGTSGWSYKHWVGPFYPAKVKASDELSYYSEHLQTVEINNSFYRLPTEKTFSNWRDSVPKDFLFSVKGSRYITHLKKLKAPEESLNLLLKRSEALKEKLGPILFQLPPWWKINHERLEYFLKQLPKDHRFVFEFRNHTWYEEKIYDLLNKYNCAFCIYELAGHLSPSPVTANFAYVRLHGPEEKYEGDYSDKTLTFWANQCREWLKDKKDFFIYFDNDQFGYAVKDALRLREMLKEMKS